MRPVHLLCFLNGSTTLIQIPFVLTNTQKSPKERKKTWHYHTANARRSPLSIPKFPTFLIGMTMTADFAKLIFSYYVLLLFSRVECSLAILIKIPVGAFYRSANSIIISRKEEGGNNNTMWPSFSDHFIMKHTGPMARELFYNEKESLMRIWQTTAAIFNRKLLLSAMPHVDLLTPLFIWKCAIFFSRVVVIWWMFK